MTTSLAFKAQEAMKTCNKHEHELLTCFCKTCRKFICTACAKTSHHGHDWDLIASVAKVRRRNTQKLCRQIRTKRLKECQEKLRIFKEAVKDYIEKDMEKLEKRRVVLINLINHFIDEQKKKRDDLARNEKTMDSKCHDLQNKLDYVEKLTTCLESNNAEYSDYDVIEAEQNMLTALEEIEQYNVNRPASVVRYVPGDINEGSLREMIGTIEDSTTNIDAIIKVQEIEEFKVRDDAIRNIAPISNTQAWVDNSRDNHIALMSIEKGEIKHMKFSSYFRDFISLSNDQFIAISSNTKTIRRVLSNGKESVIAKTKPLRPTFISKTHTDDIFGHCKGLRR